MTFIINVCNNIYVLGAGNQFRIYSGGTASLNIATNGNTLIGTTTDSGAKLHISGSTSQALLIASSSAGPALFVSGSGNIGIGTATPVSKINVVTPNNGDALRLEVPSTNSTVYDFYLGNSGTTSYIRDYAKKKLGMSQQRGRISREVLAAYFLDVHGVSADVE